MTLVHVALMSCGERHESKLSQAFVEPSFVDEGGWDQGARTVLEGLAMVDNARASNRNTFTKPMQHIDIDTMLSAKALFRFRSLS